MHRIIISDFDSTITKEDTINVLAKLPYLIKPNFTPKWAYFRDLYSKNYNKLHPKLLANRHVPLLSPGFSGFSSVANYKKSLSKEFEYQNLLRNLEMSSTNEMSKCKLFEGISFGNVDKYARMLKEGNYQVLRPEFVDFMSLSNISPEDFFILSVNWSSEFIKCVLAIEGYRPLDLISKEHIFCNDLLSDADGVYTGEFSNSLLTGSDKVQVMENSILKNLMKDGCDPWYIGDSETDFLCILHPLVNGILFVDPSKSLEELVKLTVKSLGLVEGTMSGFLNDSSQLSLPVLEKGNGKRCYIAKSWRGVAHILGLGLTTAN